MRSSGPVRSEVGANWWTAMGIPTLSGGNMNATLFGDAALEINLSLVWQHRAQYE
jgi:hypothetical protein